MRKQRTGPSGPVRILSRLAPAAAAMALAAVAPVAPAEAQARQVYSVSGQELPDFYNSRAGAPLWFGQPGNQAEAVIRLLASAGADGLDSRKYRVEALERAVEEARSGKIRAIRWADILLSQAFVDYVRDLRAPGKTGVVYVDSELRPRPPSPRAILEAAARAPSLERYVAGMEWMHPVYGQLRRGLLSDAYTPEQRDLIRVNLERARELPAGPGRYLLVNAAQQRLYMYQGGDVVDSMRVVVGKPKYPTPMMAAFIRFAALNPYWYVPADLTAERIAPNVLKQGLPYLERQGYQVVSDFIGQPAIIDPTTIDWQAVADGRLNILVRQLPGPHNSMGRIKFMFPNSEGVYLHDNPERELFEQAARLYSGGCVRLEDAWRLSRWLFNGRELSWQGAGTEEKVPLETPVPVYITYLTTVPDGSRIAFLDDVYKRDATRIAELRQRGGSLAAN